VVISLNNFVLNRLAFALAPLQRHATESGADKDIMWRLSLAMVINTCLINVVVETDPDKWGAASGLKTQVVLMCLSNAFVPLIRLVDFGWVSNRVQRFFFERNTDPQKKLTAVEKETYENFWLPSPMNLPAVYASAIKTFFLAMIYAPIAPITAPLLCLLGLVLQYYTDKFFVVTYALKPYANTMPVNAAAALDIIDNGVMFGGAFAGLFIGYNGTHGWRALLIGIAISIVLVLIKFLPRKYERAVLLAFVDDANFNTDCNVDYYEAQYYWTDEDKYQKSYPLYKSLPEEQNPSNFEKPGNRA